MDSLFTCLYYLLCSPSMQGLMNLFGKIEEKHFRLNLIVSLVFSAPDMFTFCLSTDARHTRNDLETDRLYFSCMIIMLSLGSNGHPHKKLSSIFNLLRQEIILVVVIIFDFMSSRSLEETLRQVMQLCPEGLRILNVQYS